jgi:hypothetical protein
LFNLLPAHREVNQRLKRERLPSKPTLLRAGDAIGGWWEDAYVSAGNGIRSRFRDEAGEPARDACRPEEDRNGGGIRRARVAAVAAQLGPAGAGVAGSERVNLS